MDKEMWNLKGCFLYAWGSGLQRDGRYTFCGKEVKYKYSFRVIHSLGERDGLYILVFRTC